jgi:hypothetical protein
MNHLTPSERAAYRDGSWLTRGWDSEHGPRCYQCGCLESNHTWTEENGMGPCDVCGCPMYEEQE